MEQSLEGLAVTPALGSTPSAPAAPSLHDHRGERTRRLAWALFTSLLTKPLAFVTPIVTVPLFLHYLGKDRYGLFESIGALSVWIALSNGGLTLGLINQLTDCHVSGDRVLARKYTSSLMFVLLAATTVLTLVASAVVPAVNWGRVFPTDDPIGAREIPMAVWISAMATLWGVVFSVPQPIYAAYQENHRSNFWDGAAKLLTLVSCLLVVKSGWGLVGVIAAAAGVTTLVRLVNAVIFFTWEKRWLMPSPRFFDRKLFAGTIKQGFGLFVISTASMAIFQVDKLVIGHIIGQEEVAQYSVIGRPFMLVFGLYSLLLGPLWPAHGEALRRGDIVWVRRILKLTLACGGCAILLCGAAMFFYGDWILTVWTRGNFIHVSRPLVVAMTGLFLLWIWTGSLSILLNSANVIRSQMWFLSAHAVLNVILACALAKPFGVTGVAWSMTITGLATTVWGYPWMIRNHIFRRVATAPAPVVA